MTVSKSQELSKRELSQLIPPTIIAARTALADAMPAVRQAKTYAELRGIERWARALRSYWRHIEDIRHAAERVIILAAWRSGQMANIEGHPASGGIRPGPGRGHKSPLPVEAGFYRPTLTDMFDSGS
jgi:hypothetical protein